MERPVEIPAGQIAHRADPNPDRSRCASCGFLSKRARVERDHLCLRCYEEAIAS